MTPARPPRALVAAVAFATAAFPIATAFGSNCPAGDAALNNNTPLSSICDRFTSALGGQSLQQAMQSQAGNVQMISAAAQQQGVPVSLALAVSYQESHFQSCAGSPTGVQGPMQLTQRTGAAMGYNRNINEQNIKGGMAVLRNAVNACGETNYSCLAARYNGSTPGQQAEWARGVQRADQQMRSDTSIQDQACSGNSQTAQNASPNTGGSECGAPEGAETPSSPITSDADYKKYVGQKLGVNEQCASLTKYFSPSVGAASTWRKGDLVQGNTNIKPGTPIATFNFGDKYGPSDSPGGQSGVSHTGIYMGQSAAGVQMLNQWSGSGGAQITTIPWSSWNGNAAEGGSRYYTISH